MRTLAKVTIPVEAGNKTIKDGTLPKMMNAILEDLKPEASYFFSENGKRTAWIIFDMKDPSQIPAVVEPFFMAFNANVELVPVMNRDDLKSGLEKAARKF